MNDPWHNVKVAFILNAMPVTNLVNLQLHDAKKMITVINPKIQFISR